MWWLKIGYDSKSRTELKILWSSGVLSAMRHDFAGNIEFFLYEKHGELGPKGMDHHSAWSMVDQPPCPATEFTGARLLPTPVTRRPPGQHENVEVTLERLTGGEVTLGAQTREGSGKGCGLR
jgi:hypothetical protein